MNFNLIQQAACLFKRFRTRSSSQASPVWADEAPQPCGNQDSNVVDFYLVPESGGVVVSGETINFMAVQLNSCGVKEIVTDLATWTVDDSSAAQVDSPGVISGTLSTPDTGFTSASVNVMATYNGRQATSVITVRSMCNDCLIDLVFVLDRSNSMLAGYGKSGKSCIDLVRETMQVVLGNRYDGRDKFGVVSFGGKIAYKDNVRYYALSDATLDCPLTETTAELTASLSAYQVRTPSVEQKGGVTYMNAASGIGDGIRMARAELTGARARADAVKVIVLLTDGIESVTPATEPQEAATAAKASEIKIYIVGVNVPSSYHSVISYCASDACAYQVSTPEAAIGILQSIPNAVCRSESEGFDFSKISGILSDEGSSDIPYGYLW